MSITPTAQDLLRPEPKRDRWGRYVVAGVKGGKGKGYTRVTTLTKTCSDTVGLTEWAKRVVAVGVAKRPDLIAQAANLTADDKSELREIIAAAEEVGGANEKRRLGTALHKILEIIDLGGDANKDRFSGLWKDGKKHGKGTYIVDASKVKLVGEWFEGSLTSGQWVLANGDAFEGGFKHNKPIGKGTWTLKNGSRVDGVYSQEYLENDGKVNV